MAPRRRSFRRRGRRPFRRYGRRKTASFARSVKRVILRTTEYKYAATIVTATTVPNGVSIFNTMPPTSVGDGKTNRDGSQIYTMSYQVMLNFVYSDNTTTGAPGTMRLYWVWPKKLSTTDAISFITAQNFPPTALMDQYNWIVWRDKLYNLNEAGKYGGGGRKFVTIKWFKKFRHRDIYADGTASVPEKCPFLVISTVLQGMTNVAVNGYIKATFKDI